jgi:murein DD-endopeptidase MepM/ murein hydrolase activator NlpD
VRTAWPAPLLALALAACAGLAAAPEATARQAVPAESAATAADGRIVFPPRVPQGALVFGKVPAGSTVRHAGRELRVTGYGTVVFGVPRDAQGTLAVEVAHADGRIETVPIAVEPRDFGLEVIDGVPPRTVEPPPAVAARIAREAAAVAQARTRDDPRTGFAGDFDWPVRGRISGRFGSGRVYNGRPGGGHSGMDIAAPAGTPVRAPASGVVTLADDLYITGGTVLLDHGHGVSSNFLHLSRIDVKPGDQVAKGDVIGAVGATGRATGPHLHWGMNWFDVRVDPLLVLERAGKTTPPP